MQANLYFVSILLMTGLTGWLAFYAWQQKKVPGARVYAALAVCECLLALTEMLSMLSLGLAQALFWFNTRFLFTGAISVLFLVFALEYNGHKVWLSRPLIAAAFIIPILTQFILWSNKLPGLWEKQEVSFHQMGLFWFSDTSARIPGLWFLVQSFYSLLLLSAGIGVILITAWRKPRLYGGQALLLSAGALIALVTALIPTLNLVPPGGINPFIPGVGASAMLYALAIFRLQFLRRAPTDGAVSKHAPLEAQGRRSLAFFLFIFLLLVSGMSAIGYLSYRHYASQFRAQVEGKLSAIGSLKLSGMEEWRADRLKDGKAIQQNDTFAVLVQKLLDNPLDAQAQGQLQNWLDILYRSGDYKQVFLQDASGVEKMSSPAQSEAPAHLGGAVPSTLKAGQVVFLDFHRHVEDGSINLAILIPIYAGKDINRPLGVLTLEIDPATFLYPYIQEWPTLSASAETLLVRRDGSNVLFLNPLRFQKDAAVNLRIPLTNTQSLAVKAVSGQTGVVEGVDYRGVPVIGDIHPVPGSPWFLVSRMDIAEVYAPMQERLWQTLFLFGALIFASGAGLGLVWRQQRMNSYRAYYQAAEELRVSDEKIKKAFLITPDAITITRLSDGRFVSVNQGFTNILGYTEADVIGKTSLELDIWAEREDRKKVVAALQAYGNVENYEAKFLTKSGGLVDGLMSAALIELNGEPHVINSTRDITGRKREEEALQKSEENYRLLFEQAVDGIFIADREGNYVDVNSSGCTLLGYSRDEILRLNMHDLVTSQDQQKTPLKMNELQAGNSVSSQRQMRCKDGSLIDVEISGRMLPDGRLQGMVRNITERKRVEKELHWQNEYLTALQETTLELLSQLDPETLLENIVRRAGLLMGTSSGYLDLVDPESGLLKPRVGIGALAESLKHQVQPGEGIAGTVWQTGQPLVVNHYDQWVGRIGGYTHGLLASVIGVPLLYSGKVLGVLGLGYEYDTQRTFEPGDVEILTQFARLAAIAIENARLLSVAQQELAERKLKELQLLAAQAEMQALLAKADQSRRALLSVVEDQKRVEEALQSSQERYRLISTVASDYMFSSLLDANGKLTLNWVAGAFEAITGYTYEDYVAHGGWRAALHPDDLAVDDRDIEKLRMNQPVITEVRTITKTGRVVWVRVYAHPVFDMERKELVGIFGAVQDISERKQVENALRESENRFRTLFEQAAVGVALVETKTGRYIEINKCYCDFLGYTKEEMLNLSFQDVTCPDDVQENIENNAALLTGKIKEFTIEKRYFRKDRNIVWGNLAGSPLWAPGEKPLHYLHIAVVQDITERKRAEEALKQRVKELSIIYQAAQRLQQQFTPKTLARQIIEIIETLANYDYAAVLLIGQDSETLIPFALSEQGKGSEFIEQDKVYIESQAPRLGRGITGWVAQNGQSFLSGDVTQEPVYFAMRPDIHSELCVPLRVGKTVIGVLNIETNRSAAYNTTDQNVLETVATQIAAAIQNTRLLEELQRNAAVLEQRVAERTAQLEASNKELEAFAYSVSHDLRAPLRAIDGFSRILQEDHAQKLDEEGLRLLGVVRENTSRMDHLIIDLLALSRVSRSELRYSPIDMASMANSIYHELATPEVLEKFVFKVSDLPFSSGDPTLIRQVWTNLISNAIKYTMPKAKCVIEIDGWKKDGLCTYSIEDNGVGFNPRYTDKLFGLFQRLHKAGDFEGTGVGLAIVQRIIHRHGGQTWGEGQVGAGATFYFSIPERQINHE